MAYGNQAEHAKENKYDIRFSTYTGINNNNYYIPNVYAKYTCN